MCRSLWLWVERCPRSRPRRRRQLISEEALTRRAVATAAVITARGPPPHPLPLPVAGPALPGARSVISRNPEAAAAADAALGGGGRGCARLETARCGGGPIPERLPALYRSPPVPARPGGRLPRPLVCLNWRSGLPSSPSSSPLADPSRLTLGWVSRLPAALPSAPPTSPPPHCPRGTWILLVPSCSTKKHSCPGLLAPRYILPWKCFPGPLPSSAGLRNFLPNRP